MVFSATVFLYLFLPIVLIVHTLAPRRFRNPWLLAASLFFYGWGEPRLLGAMVVSIAINGLAGVHLGRHRGRRVGRIALALAITANLALLAWFKYRGFFGANLDHLLGLFGREPMGWAAVALPVGISFYTFQAMSYLVDVWRGDTEPQRDVISFAMYIALFPQLVAGPIVRYREIAREIAERRLSRSRFATGVRRFIIGLGKKMLIANVAAVTADAVFDLDPAELTTAVAWVGVLAYTIQIYFDFSGYSDMAIGLGLMLGFTFPENFRHPYVATSVTDFWRRWHITLSSWFRDYLYIPLGGNRGGGWRTRRNLLVVFLLCGLWHGPAWTFVIWGLWHGAFLVFERSAAGRRLQSGSPILGRIYLLSVVVAGWVFFRADDLSQALAMFAAMFGGGAGDPGSHPLSLVVGRDAWFVLPLAILGSTPWMAQLRARLAGVSRRTSNLVHGLATAALALVFFASAVELAAQTHNPFIYFRF
ncbi:MAG: MBOAT family protein [Planctomycetes bacterium]|nr:MBOAT family protein [Planctomycetota bacterium]